MKTLITALTIAASTPAFAAMTSGEPQAVLLKYAEIQAARDYCSDVRENAQFVLDHPAYQRTVGEAVISLGGNGNAYYASNAALTLESQAMVFKKRVSINRDVFCGQAYWTVRHALEALAAGAK